MTTPYARTTEGRGLAAAPGSRAFVVFSGHAELKWLRLLRPGYRHCFAVLAAGLRDRQTWIVYNPLSVGTQLEAWTDVSAAELVNHLEGQGLKVVEVQTSPLGHRPWGWRPFTCVEAVKRVLGLRAPGVWTPWQLQNHLKNHIERK